MLIFMNLHSYVTSERVSTEMITKGNVLIFHDSILENILSPPWNNKPETPVVLRLVLRPHEKAQRNVNCPRTALST